MHGGGEHEQSLKTKNRGVGSWYLHLHSQVTDQPSSFVKSSKKSETALTVQQSGVRRWSEDTDDARLHAAEMLGALCDGGHAQSGGPESGFSLLRRANPRVSCGRLCYSDTRCQGCRRTCPVTGPRCLRKLGLCPLGLSKPGSPLDGRLHVHSEERAQSRVKAAFHGGASSPRRGGLSLCSYFLHPREEGSGESVGNEQGTGGSGGGRLSSHAVSHSMSGRRPSPLQARRPDSAAPQGQGGKPPSPAMPFGNILTF